MDIHDLRKFLKQNFSRAEVYDTQWEYRRNMLSRWNVHNEQVLRMMKKAVSFRPIVDIQQFITENICDIPDKPDIEAMQQNIRNYKRHEQLAQQQEEKLTALQEISTLYREMTRSVDRWRVQSFLVQWAQKGGTCRRRSTAASRKSETACPRLTAADTAIEDLAGQVQAKEERRRQLDRDYAQSDTYQERRRLGNQKQSLLTEQSKLVQEMERDALEIKREALRLTHLCERPRLHGTPRRCLFRCSRRQSRCSVPTHGCRAANAQSSRRSRPYSRTPGRRQRPCRTRWRRRRISLAIRLQSCSSS